MTDVRMDRHGNVMGTAPAQKQHGPGMDVRVDRHGRVVKVLGRKNGSGQKGGPGSGHHGHAGRPGQVGGSAPAGEYIHLSKEQRRAARKGVQNGIKGQAGALAGLTLNQIAWASSQKDANSATSNTIAAIKDLLEAGDAWGKKLELMPSQIDNAALKHGKLPIFCGWGVPENTIVDHEPCK